MTSDSRTAADIERERAALRAEHGELYDWLARAFARRMITEAQAVAIARARAEEKGWGFAEPIAVVVREAWFSKRVLRYEIETNAGMLGAKARFVIDAKSGAIQI